MLARIRKAKEENEGGFTLIELLVVVVIIGILAAIAIPTFLNQREKAWEKAAQSDLRNVAVQLEEHFSENGSYPANKAAFNTGIPAKFSEDVTLADYSLDTGNYCVEVSHDSLTANWVLRSEIGRPLPVGTATDGTTAPACN